MLREGTWWLRSESNPKWNISGRGQVGMFMTTCAEANNYIAARRAQFGEEPPDDLSFGYMKD